MAFKHHKWEKSGRTSYNPDTQQYKYHGLIGEQQTWDGLKWLPYLWKASSNRLQYGHNSADIEFASDKQILKIAEKIICSSFKFFVQAYIGDKWVNQSHGISTKNIADNYPIEGRCTGYLDFPDAHLSFGAQNPYNLQIGLEVGRSERATFGFRFKAPVSGQIRFQAVLDGLEKLPNDWEWIWAKFAPEKNKEDRKIGIRVKDLEWRWTYDESPQRNINVETNPDGTKKITITFGSYDYIADEWLTIYPDQWGETGVTNTNDDCDENGGVDLDGYDADGCLCGWAHDYSCRFQNVTITGNPTSVDAGTQIEYDCGFRTATPFDFKVFGLEGDTPAFNVTAPSTRTRTTASITLPRPNAGVDKIVDGADFQAVVKEILDTSWSSGYDIGFSFDNNGVVASNIFFQIEDFSTGTAARLTIVYTAAVGVTLTVAALDGAGLLDNTVLTQKHSITVQELLGSGLLDNVVLTQKHLLVLQELLSSGALDSIVLIQKHILSVQELSGTGAVDNVSLTQKHILAIQELLSAGTLDNVELITAILLVVADLVSSGALDSNALTQKHILMVQEGLSAGALDGVALTQKQLLAVQDLLSSGLIDNISFDIVLGLICIALSEETEFNIMLSEETEFNIMLSETGGGVC